MTKLTLKDCLSFETQTRIALLQGKTKPDPQHEAFKRQEENNGYSQALPSSESIKPRLEPKEMSCQEKEDRAKARERFNITKAWLEETYPKAFNFTDPKPLKLGIQNDLMGAPSPLSKRQLSKGLNAYVHSPLYLKATVKGQWRYDLIGQQSEEISQEHKDYAKQRLAERKLSSQSRKTASTSKNAND